jgi:hypothetical protein
LVTGSKRSALGGRGYPELMRLRETRASIIVVLSASCWLASCVGGAAQGATEPDPDDVAPAAPAHEARLEEPAAPASKGLDAETVRRRILDQSSEFQRCFATAQARDPNLSGLVVVAFEISPAGTVHSLALVESSQPPDQRAVDRQQFTTLSDAEALDCILGAYGRLTFPPADKPTRVRFPLLLRRSD